MVDKLKGNQNASKPLNEHLNSVITVRCTKEFKAWIMGAKDEEDKIGAIGRTLFANWASKQYETKAKYKQYLEDKD